MVIALAVLALLQATTATAAVVPAGFSDEQVMRAQGPTAVAFTPDGRMLVTTQSGRLKLRDAAGRVTDALDLSERICAGFERGLLGVAVDPDFAVNGYLYVFYTRPGPGGGCPTKVDPGPVNRVSRFVLGADGIARDERVLLDGMLSFAGNHNGGDLAFGRDGFLYVTVGDSGCDYAQPDRCGAANDAARDAHVLLGKVLRVDRDGVAPAVNGGGATCALSGRTTPGQRCRETFASGLRNPFRFAFDPNAASTRFFINDVGQSDWEEINEGLLGADYGWNQREGRCRTGSSTDCPAAPASLTDPFFIYAHGDCSSITGGAFVPNGAWAPEYDGSYLYSDYVCGSIFRLDRSSGSWRSTPVVTGLGRSSAVHLTFGPGPRGPALYYTTYADGGEVRRLYWNAGANAAPTARLTARPTSGRLPLTVELDASGSDDPEGGSLTYLWEFGDGTSAEGGSARISHTYSRAGRYVASLRVRDERGALSGASTVTIAAGEQAPEASVRSETGSEYEFLESVSLTGSASDAEDGRLPGGGLSWEVLIEHGQHTHPYAGPATGSRFTFKAPAPEDAQALATTSLRVTMTATDSSGLATREVFRLRPVRVLGTLRPRLDPRGLRRSGRVRVPRVVRGGDRHRLTVRLTGAARLRLNRQRAAAGRRVGGSCRPVERGNSSRPRCVRWTAVKGSWSSQLPRGTSRLRFGGRLVAGEKLRAGRHRLVLRARDQYGRRSPVARVSYRLR